LALSPLIANAQEGDSVEAFRAHIQRGVELKKAGDLREALESFEKARAIADHPKLALATGRIYEEIGDCSAARAQFSQGLEDRRTDGALQEKFDEALAANAECVDRGVLVVECEPQDAKLVVGGDTLACPAEVELTAGEYTIDVSAPDHQSRSVAVTIEPAGQHRTRVELGAAWQKTAVTYTTYGALGLGGALLVGGIVSDASASSRQDELMEASGSGDLQRTRRLADEAESAQNTTIALYSTAAVLLAGGAVLWIYGDEAEALITEDGSASSAQLQLKPDGAVLEATFRW
jgi:tetratricopeptide (TPR) repeat protein